MRRPAPHSWEAYPPILVPGEWQVTYLSNAHPHFCCPRTGRWEVCYSSLILVAIHSGLSHSNDIACRVLLWIANRKHISLFYLRMKSLTIPYKALRECLLNTLTQTIWFTFGLCEHSGIWRPCWGWKPRNSTGRLHSGRYEEATYLTHTESAYRPDYVLQEISWDLGIVNLNIPSIFNPFKSSYLYLDD